MRFKFFYLFLIIQNNIAYPNKYEPPISIPNSELCKSNCEVPYGDFIGLNRNVKAFSNCNSKCINRPGFKFKKEDTGLIRDIWIGLPWQCVEYVRRWVLQNQKIEFKDVDFAYEIWDRNIAKKLTNGASIKYTNFKNGSSTYPKFGDLLIYDKSSYFPYGHVAVIVNVDLVSNYIDVAEENFQNKKWEDMNSYSRRIELENVNNNYIITDISFKSKKRYTDFDTKIIGWKRLREE